EDESRPYIIVSNIGKGSFATVYKGCHKETHHQVAVKSVRRVVLTAKLLDNLQLFHRHITKLIDVVMIFSVQNATFTLIMEYCTGGDLTNYIKKHGRVDTRFDISSTAKSSPRYVCSVRHLISHCMQNLLLNPASPEVLAKGHPLGVPILKVADFGFARSLPNATMAETLCGSPLYMAPEILRYEKYES
ncbi:hypothetical protein CY34DRAFT_766481, partial [Suillus luteus UH-Slu-Lm8-n1]